jgi:hypothetical protein
MVGRQGGYLSRPNLLWNLEGFFPFKSIKTANYETGYLILFGTVVSYFLYDLHFPILDTLTPFKKRFKGETAWSSSLCCLWDVGVGFYSEHRTINSLDIYGF